LKYKYLIILCSVLLCSSKLPKDYSFYVHPVKCFDNPYVNNLLDSLREVESSNGKRTLNINRDKKGKELSRDEGDYQLNSSCKIVFANAYNEGKMYNPYNDEVARKIARQLLIDNYNYSGNWFDALVIYNCGIGRWESINNIPYKSFIFAEKVLRGVKL